MRTHLMSHVVRRGVQHLTRRQQYPDQLLQDAQAYEDAGPEMEVQPRELLFILVTALVGFLVVCSVRQRANASRHLRRLLTYPTTDRLHYRTSHVFSCHDRTLFHHHDH